MSLEETYMQFLFYILCIYLFLNVKFTNISHIEIEIKIHERILRFTSYFERKITQSNIIIIINKGTVLEDVFRLEDT